MNLTLDIHPLEKFIVFGAPDIGEQEIQAVTEVLESGWIGTGKVAKELEEEFVKYMQGGYAIAVSSCSIGLVLALKSVGVSHGDSVITSPLTFCATVNAILQLGARPVFCDVDSRGCLDNREVLKKDLKSIAAILPVNYTGFQAKGGYDYTIPWVEDAAHSFGGTYLGKKQGSFGDVSVFSLYATKNITSAEGGIIWTKHKELADQLRILSQQGQTAGAWKRYSSEEPKDYEVLIPGYKANLPDVLAAIGLVQMRRWPEIKRKRDLIWNIYEQAFGPKETGHSRHLYTIQVKGRKDIRKRLFDRHIGTGIHYHPLHLEPAYKFLGYKKGDFPKAEKIGEETLSLPISAKMTTDDARRVVEEVKCLI